MNTSESIPRPRSSTTVSDGRRLGWYEYGDAAGTPCVFLAGTATSGLAGAAFDRAARAAGVRLISIDRPGLGSSDRAQRRPLLHWSDDVRELMDHMRVSHFSVLGHSAGGAYSLAVARALPDRVSLT